MRRAVPTLFAFLLVFVLVTAGISSSAQGEALNRAQVQDTQASQAMQPEPVVNQANLQAGDGTSISLPKGVPELANSEPTAEQLLLQQEKKQAEENRQALKIIQNHDQLLELSRQAEQMEMALSPEVAPVQAAATPPAAPYQEVEQPRIATAEDRVPLGPAAISAGVLDNLHRNDALDTTSVIQLTNDGPAAASVNLVFSWPDNTPIASYDPAAIPVAGTITISLADIAGLGGYFYGSATINSDQPLTASVISPAYGVITGLVYATDGTTVLPGSTVELWADIGNNNFDGRGGYGLLPSGRFYLPGLPDGTYIMRASAGYPYASQFFGEAVVPEEATKIHIVSGGILDNANFTLQPGGKISGTVYAADGVTPLPNTNFGTDVGWYGGCTGPDGTFILDNLPYGNYIVRAGGDWNWCAQEQSIYVTEYYPDVVRMDQATPVNVSGAQDTRAGINFTLDVGGKITGKVRSQVDGSPLENVHVAASIYDQNDEWYWGHASTDADGNYSIVGLATGTYRIRVDDAGTIPPGLAKQYYDHTDYLPNATPVGIATNQVINNINFDLPAGGTISGTVYAADGKTPLPNINVDLEQGWYGTCTDANGHYTIPNVPYGSHFIRAGGDWNWCTNQQSVYVRQYYDKASRIEMAAPIGISDAQSIYTNIDFNLDLGGTISGVVKAEGTGLPLENVHVQASIYDQNDEWYWGQTWTDAAGNYTIVGLAAGDYRVRIDDGNGIPAGYSAQYYDHTWNYQDATPVSISFGGAVTGINFDLAPGGTIRGRLTDQVTGDPIANENVQANNNAGYGAGTCTDAGGYYQISGLLFGDYQVSAGGGWNWCKNQQSAYAREYWNETISSFNYTPVNVNSTTPVEGIDFTLSAGGYISGKVTDGSNGNAPVSGLRIAVIVLNPQNTFQQDWVETVDTDAEGNFTIGPLAEQNYKVYACADCSGQLLVSEYYPDVYDIRDAQDVSVIAGATHSGVNLVLGKGLWITGHVTVPEGYSAQGIQIDAWLFDSNYGTGRQTDANGDYVVPVPPIYDSMWGISATPWNTGLESEWAHRVWLDQSHNFDFNLGLGATIQGCLTDGTNPIQGGWVSAESSVRNFGVNIGPDGCYTIPHLPPGIYRVRADNWPANYPAYYGAINWEYAGLVTLSQGETETGIDFVLPIMGALQGVVSDFSSHNPLEGIQVTAMNDKGYFQAWTQVDGTYFMDLPAGDYKIFYMQESWLDYFAAFYPYATSYEAASLVSVPARDPNGNTSLNIDMHQKAWITGQVTDSVSGDPVGGIFVKVYTQGAGGSFEPAWTSSTCTGPDGNFSLEAFWPGKPYKITAAGSCGAFSYPAVSRNITVQSGGHTVENIQVIAGGPVEIPFTVRTGDTDFLPENSARDLNLPLLFEPLAKLDDQGNWTSNLLEQVPTLENGGVQVTNNQMAVTYTLKPGLLWSDGQPLTSADIQYAWERFTTPTMWWNVGNTLVTRIQRIETPDPLTAVVYFFKDQFAVNYLDAIPYAIPRHVLQNQYPFMFNRFYLENPVGNGPYIVESFLTDSHVDLRANPNYVLRSQGLPRIETIRQLAVGNPYWLLSNNLAQVATEVLAGQEIPADAGSFLNVKATTDATTEFVWLNNDNPTLQDATVRKALLLALDRTRLAAYGQTGNNYPGLIKAENFIPPGHPMYSNTFPRYNDHWTFGLNSLMSNGWLDHNGNGILDKNGVELEFTFAYPENNDRRMQLASIFQETLSDMGVRLTLLPQPDFQTMTDKGAHGMFDMYPLAWITDRFDPGAYTLWHSSQIPTAYNSYEGQSISRWRNAANDTLLEATNGKLSFGDLKNELAAWTQNLMDQVPALPTVHWLKYDVAAETLVNFKPAAGVPATWNAAEWYLPDNPYDLGVRATLSPESNAPWPSTFVTYMINVDNLGYFGVTGAVLVDTLFDPGTFLSADPAPTTFSSNKLTWDLGDIPAGQKPKTIKVNMLVPDTALVGAPIRSIVGVYINELDTRPSNNSIIYTFNVLGDADLWLEKHGIGQPAIGEKFTYYIEYGNSGGTWSDTTTITDTLPAEVTFISADPAPFAIHGNELVWQIPSIPGDRWGGQIKVLAEIASPGHVVNEARIFPVEGEPILLDNEDDHIEDVSSILAPVILRPTSGMTDGAFPVKGLAPTSSTVDLYDIKNPATPILLGSGSATAAGTFEIALSLPEGSYILAATATKSGLTSGYSNTAAIQVNHSLPLDPDEMTIKVDGVDFSAGVVRAEQYTLSHRLLEIDAMLPCDTAPSPVSLQVNENGLFNYSVAPVALVDQGGKWKASFRFWLSEPRSKYDVKLAWTCEGIEKQELLVYILIDPDGYVFNKALVDGGSAVIDSLITDATVVAYAKVGEDWVLWPANLYGQHNPQVTDSTTGDDVSTPGYYSFLTPPGQYRIEATAPGFLPYQSGVLTVISDPIHLDIPMEPVKGGTSKVAAPANITTSSFSVEQTEGSLGSELTYHLVLDNQGGFDTGEFWAYVSIPAHTTFVPGSLTADSGEVTYDAGMPRVQWIGAVPAGQVVQVSFKVKVTGVAGPFFTVTSTASLGGPEELVQNIGPLTASTDITMKMVFLPLVKR